MSTRHDVAAPAHPSAAERIDRRVAELGDWRGEMLARVRAVIRAADPGVVEEWKWENPVWSLGGGIVCTGESYRDKVKLTFARGASLPDLARVFNASLEGKARRAIDIGRGDTVNVAALADLVRAAGALNAAGATPHGRGRAAR